MMLYRKALPLSVPNVDGECATSLAARLAKRNGVPRFSTFCTDLGVDYFDLCTGSPYEIQKIAELAGQEPGPLLRHTPRIIEDDWFKLGNERIKFTAFSRTRPRICPVCFREASEGKQSAFQRGVWQLTSVRTCHLHGCLLQEFHTSSDNKGVFDFARFMTSNQCAHPEFVKDHHRSLEEYMLRRIDGVNGQEWIDNLPLHVVSQTSEMFGLLLTKGPKAVRKRTAEIDWVLAGKVGFSFLRNGPEAFEAKLREMAVDVCNEHRRHLWRFGVFFNWLRDRAGDSNFDVIRDIVRNFVFDTYPLRPGTQVLGVKLRKQRRFRYETIAKKAELDKAIFANVLVEAGLLIPKKFDAGYEETRPIRSDEVAPLVQRAKDYLRPNDAASFLNVSRRQLNVLQKKGVIASCRVADRSRDVYHVAELKRFMSSIDRNFVPACELKKTRGDVRPFGDSRQM